MQEDAEAQTAAMRSVLAGRFGADTVTIDRLLQAAAVPIGPVDAAGDAAALDLLAGQVLADAVRTVDGAEAAAPDEVALHALAAEQLGLAVGDAVVLEPTGSALTVAGTWLPVDPADPLWFGDPLVAAGALDAGAPEQRFGPAIVAESALDGLDPRPYATFIVRPSAGLADPGALGAVRAALDGLDDSLRDDPVAGRGGVIVDGRLGASLDGILRSLTAVSAVAPVPQLVVAVVAALALLPVVRLVVAAREGESLLLRARGASATALLRRTAAEALLVAVLPAGLAAAVVAGVVLLAGGGLAGGGLAGQGAAYPVLAAVPIALRAAALALLVGLLAGILLLALTAASTRRAGGRLGSARLAAGRGAPAVSGMGIVIVLAAAALAVEQLRRSGSPLVAGAGGELVVNPLAVLAPVLALLAASLLAGALFPVVAGVVAGAARRRRSLGPVLVGRALARLGAVFAVPVLLVSLATGTAVVAAVYDASWSRGTPSPPPCATAPTPGCCCRRSPRCPRVSTRRRSTSSRSPPSTGSTPPRSRPCDPRICSTRRPASWASRHRDSARSPRSRLRGRRSSRRRSRRVGATGERCRASRCRRARPESRSRSTGPPTPPAPPSPPPGSSRRRARCSACAQATRSGPARGRSSASTSSCPAGSPRSGSSAPRASPPSRRSPRRERSRSRCPRSGCSRPSRPHGRRSAPQPWRTLS
ncbi:hypothetical protein OVN20_07370 [Microcella daejeonensis]|uniref:hypothetical protein n=1 Tax=Microcella daejeonensis TaxID=2994971 RepID=UPI00226E2863|nr:hypothetical protein [Microcella daejeonensis]WAB82934.1 hypothetical protein OVN20_07370 [Microcella daejeonensis]